VQNTFKEEGMITYLVRRSLQSLLILFLISIAMYGILNLSACGPYCDVYGGQYKTTQDEQNAIDRAKKLYGLDDPLPERYVLWLYNWKPVDNEDPEYLAHQLFNFQEEDKSVTEPSRKAFVEQHIKDLTQQLASANQKLAACADLFNLDNLGTCLSINRRGGILTGNWGLSWKVANGEPVTDAIFGAQVIAGFDPTTGVATFAQSSVLRGPMANTLVLMLFSILLALLIAIPIGIYSAVRQYSAGDYVFSFISFVGLGLPSFCLAILLVLLAQAGWLLGLPTGGVVDDPSQVNQYGDIGIRLKHLIAPGFVLGFALMAGFSRFIRSSMLEVLRLDYVRTAWAKGLRQRTVIFKHALRNALIPLITRVALSVPALLGAVVLVDRVISYNGIGSLIYQAGLLDDWPLMMGLLIVGAVLIVISNMIADIAYAVVDPRIRYS
jgi:peptide/nickel transport system permease protein